ncbi:MAG TPA: Gfo/Idh/MocA family oxidoreductase [Kaistia sp.]|nr:Gfo/Idh/MocA family oxidoreductase [Kaistia sp.]
MPPKKKLVQVGLGGWGWSWLDIVKNSPDWELSAVVDIDPARLKTAGERYGLAEHQRQNSLKAAVDAVAPDACLVVVPPEVHAPVAIEAATLGLHALVEKPIAETIADARVMIATAKLHDVVLMVNQNYRFRRAPATVRKLIADGLIGEIGSIFINFQKAPHFGGGFREKMAHPLVVDMAIHHFDQLRGTAGFEPVEVTARSWNPKWSWFDGDASATATFRSASGAVAVYSGSWVSQGWQTTWDGDWRIQGTEGEIHWADNRIELLPKSVFTSVFMSGAREAGGRLDFDLLPLAVEDRLASLHEFHQAIAEGRAPATSGEDNLNTIATVLATRLSIERGETVTLAEVLS